jgi:hypothetical protein
LGSDREYGACYPVSPVIGEDGSIYIGAWLSGDEGSWGCLYAFGPGEPNNPPTKPTIIGPTSGRVGVEYTYTFVATDPEGDNVSYCIDWGDFTSVECTSECLSGQDVSLSHTWSEKGTYKIIVMVRDVFDNEGDLATLEVSMSRSRTFGSFLRCFRSLERFTSRFPLLEQLFVSSDSS